MSGVMVMKPLLNILVIGLLVATTPARAVGSFNDGNDLLKRCSEPKGAFGGAYCLGYAAGIADHMARNRTLDDCIPREVSIGQVRDVIVARLRNYPEERHFTAASLAENALIDAFCPELSQ